MRTRLVGAARSRRINRAVVMAGFAAAAILLTSCASAQPSAEDAPAEGTATGDAAADNRTELPSEPEPTRAAEPPPELPGGGREVFPDYRLVGYSGIKGDSNEDLGRLTGDLDARCREIQEIGKKYQRGRKLLPVFEMITVVVQRSPGYDGKYRSRRPKSEVREYLRAARRCSGILLLNIQPGRSEFLPEMKYYKNLLREPDVGVALDPEWAMDPGEIPGQSLGRSTGAELNAAAEYLAKIVDGNDLPEKVMVFHQFNLGTVERVNKLKKHDGVAIVRSVDGLGSPAIKTDEFNMLTKDIPKFIHPGFKLFYKEDVHSQWGSRLMKPGEVMKLRPQPEYILYE